MVSPPVARVATASARRKMVPPAPSPEPDPMDVEPSVATSPAASTTAQQQQPEKSEGTEEDDPSSARKVRRSLADRLCDDFALCRPDCLPGRSVKLCVDG
jgi:hypothetical protein